MSAPVISVLMPVYNVEKYIGEAIDSILNQTFRDFEFIIVDDASTDNTLSIIQSFSDLRIKIIRNENNLMLAASLNKGLQVARGKYVARMDGDDVSHPKRLEKLFDFLEKNPNIDICGSAMKLMDHENGVWEYKMDDKEIKAGMIWLATLSHGTVLMRLDTIRKHNLYYDETFKVGQDWKYWYDAMKIVTFANLNEPLYFYRRGQQSVTIKFSHQSKDRYAVMHRLLLYDFGIPFTEREVFLHQFIIGIFTITPSAKAVREARIWFKKLIRYNRDMKKFDVKAFKIFSDDRWNHLFYKIIPFGFRCVWTYFWVTGINKYHFIYYLKYLMSLKTSHR
ncbi:MAG: glycosyltransferase family 2 protein [Bacteroidetes bacterium]|nr:MAG: glycosyltransferase family 2 protein [Bacteroidota bacterium]